MQNLDTILLAVIVIASLVGLIRFMSKYNKSGFSCSKCDGCKTSCNQKKFKGISINKI